MHFSIEQEDATTVFRLKEPRIDSVNAGQLKAEFLILAQSDVETLIVDLTEVGYIDSAGLSALLLAERQMASHSGEVRLVGVTENVRSLLSLMQLDRLFPMYATVDDALVAEPSFGDDDDDEESERNEVERIVPLNPGAPTASAIKAGAIAAGGSLGAAALAKIMMSPLNEDADELLLAYDDVDDEFDDDDLDDDDDIEEDDIIEEVDAVDDVDELDEEEDDDDLDADLDEDDLDDDIEDEDDDEDDF